MRKETRMKTRSIFAVVAATAVIAAGVLAAVTIRPQPGSTELPPGFSRDSATGVLSVGAPSAAQFDSAAPKAKLAALTSALSVKSFSIDAEGHLQGFTLNSRLGTYPDGTVLICRSVTLNADSSLDNLTLTENSTASGCEMKVEIDGGVTTYSCDETTCATVCDTDVQVDPVTGKITITCVCRPAPPPNP